MTQPRTLMVGPYLLVRPLATKQLKVYEVYEIDPDVKVAALWRVASPEHGIPEEWRLRCADCPEPPLGARRESISKGFYDRDRALAWLRSHRTAKHPPLKGAA